MSTNTNDTLTERKVQGEIYLAWLKRTLHDVDLFAETRREIRDAVRGYAREHRAEIAPSWTSAGWVLLRTLGAIVGSAAASWALARAGHAWLGLLFVPVAGAALFGVTSIVHDTVHGSFAPSRRGNRVIGTILAPLVLLDFESFHASHMAHHRNSQSITQDPKYPKMPAATEEEASGPAQAAMGLWYRAAGAVKRLPSRPRHAFYLASLLLLGMPVVTLFAGDVSFRQRNWRRLSPWASLVVSLAVPALLLAVAPPLALFYVASLWFAMGLFFGVFLTHMSPYQLYMTEENPAVPFFSLNISDIVVNRAVEILGNAFTEYHAAHHLLPYVPSYRLHQVGRWVDERFAGMKAPTFRMLEPEQFNVIADSLVNSLTTEESTLIPWETEAGDLLRRTRVAHDEEEEAPAPSQRFFANAA